MDEQKRTWKGRLLDVVLWLLVALFVAGMVALGLAGAAGLG